MTYQKMGSPTRRTLSELLSPARIATAHFGDYAYDTGEQRSPFETDGDKITFTEGFRALADKTQVHDRTQVSGLHRNRLTHSIEVSRVGRSLGVALGARMIGYYGLNAPVCHSAAWSADPADIGHIVASACLSHDLGNPPFGHDGEDAIAEFFRANPTGLKAVEIAGPAVGAELQLHEGNAQGFRMISRSMGWRREGGLNLTAATLAAFGKYPFPLQPGAKKYGVHRADMSTMEFVAKATGMTPNGEGWLRHPFAWLMECADDQAYLTVDIEDAVSMGLIPIDALIELYAPVIGQEEIERGRRMGDTPRMIQYLRSRMIKSLISATVEIYGEIARDLDEGSLDKGKHCGGILGHTRHAEQMEVIRRYSTREIYKSEATQSARRIFRAAMAKVMDLLTTSLIEHLEAGRTKIDPNSPLAFLPHARLEVEIPDEPSEALPWLMDQITLMSDGQVLDLGQL